MDVTLCPTESRKTQSVCRAKHGQSVKSRRLVVGPDFRQVNGSRSSVKTPTEYRVCPSPAGILTCGVGAGVRVPDVPSVLRGYSVFIPEQ